MWSEMLIAWEEPAASGRVHEIPGTRLRFVTEKLSFSIAMRFLGAFPTVRRQLLFHGGVVLP